MSIVPMAKVSLCGRLDDKAATLEEVQALGVVHLLPLRPPQPLTPIDPEDRRRAETAFRHIMDAQDHLRPYRSESGFDRDTVIDQILANRRRLRELGDRRDELEARIQGLEAWGDFIFPDLDDLAGMRLWLYPLPVKERAALDRLELPWVVVGRGPTTLNVAVIAREEPPPGTLPVRRIRAGAGPLSRLRAELEEIEISLEEADVARASLTRWRVLLGAYLAQAQDVDALREAAEQTRDEDRIFALQGWAPADCAPALEALAEARGLAVLVEPAGPEDTPPTLLRDPERIPGAGDLTTFYTSPGYRDWDPSLIVFTSFALFFAMIMADAGYAALLGVGALLTWRRLGRSDAGRRGRTLLAALAGTSFVYGVLAGSYFGAAPPAGGVLATLAVIDVTDFDSMMVIAIAIGAIHLTVAHGAVAWLSRHRGAVMLAPLGWILVIWSGMLVWLGGETGERLGLGGVVLGLVAVYVGAAAKQAVVRPRDWLKRLGAGFIGITGISRQFGDILSYLRLFALGLASASLAGTFNMLAADLRASMPGMGLFLGILVLLVGHGITFALGIMSGFVHGLRLNFIEFFGWGLTEEGYPFKAFAKKEAPA